MTTSGLLNLKTGDALLADISDVTATAAELATLAGVTAGTVTASKALVVDANKDLATLRNVTISGNLVTGATTPSILTMPTPGRMWTTPPPLSAARSRSTIPACHCRNPEV